MMARRLKTSRFRIAALLEVLEHDHISQKDKVNQLKLELAEHYQNESFKKSG